MYHINHEKKVSHLVIIYKIREEVAIESSKIVSAKSKTVYDKEFNEFIACCREKKVNINDLEEDVLLEFFNVSQRIAPSTCTKYSMLKFTLKQYKRMAIS
ncbi:hypothetical protein Zmor_014500 [Zophobas morio]|uniref:Uncharacterized protein n=1 Tax=Zophobas morio TaxID=2755281 RepID=A0AA38IEW6_9CUCU|nr:hypothetical protein Zmor_014500 [Zophobas morio]